MNQLTLFEDVLEANAQPEHDAEPITARGALHSSQSNEWYTPAQYLEAVRAVLGQIDLDPASCELANQTVRAARYFDEQTDGLTHNWPGRVFLNPPYGKTESQSNQQLWSHRLIAQYEAGITTEAILLVNAATGDKWFEQLWSYAICFTRRIKFYAPDGQPNSPTHGNAFVYLGQRPERFIQVFSRLGVVIPAGAAIRI